MSSIDGELSDVTTTPNTTGEVVGFGSLSEGQHAIQLFVTDTTGKETQESVIIDVGPPNSTPLCEILAPSNGAAGVEGATVEFSGAVSDADVTADLLDVVWISDKDGEIGSSTPTSSGQIVFTYADLSVNSHIITLQVSDELGARCTTLVEYTVGTPPSITINNPLDGVINEGTPITFDATVQDSEDLSSDVSIDWVLNGTSFSTQGATSSGEVIFIDGSLTYGMYNLVVTATDTDGLTDVDQVSFTVNGVPTAPILEITPDPASSTSTLIANITVDSTDPEGAQINYAYEWLQNNVVVPAIPMQMFLLRRLEGRDLKVRVTNDGLIDGAVGTAQITIQNTAQRCLVYLFSKYWSVQRYSAHLRSNCSDRWVPITYQWTLNGVCLEVLLRWIWGDFSNTYGYHCLHGYCYRLGWGK